ncbi:hypothetical protein RFI_22878 [Reticulomyxa filosa]|uniref:Uncharacterized protein n=1 Tax=Reticulomyxa filosa TaxID=46433 RepID=X6MLH8_RETFI|nr:hypothetical protein RFI_22878 [Reticulomyxa filosa]|eukprot:ETO14491.1 hypothetical protein RFI_22878 [Reticulomyxa filosa]
MKSIKLTLAFELQINANIVQGLVTLGYFESSEHLSLALGTEAENVLIVSPFEKENKLTNGVTERKLAVNRKITALETAKFLSLKNKWLKYFKQSRNPQDILLIGTATNLLAYSINENTDIFYKDIPDGVHVIRFSSKSAFENNQGVAVVGGNCSIQAFDEQGEECFWTVTSDNVKSMIIFDVDNDGKNELIIGSEDCHIRVFKQGEMCNEIHVIPFFALKIFKKVKECAFNIVNYIDYIVKGKFAYALDNGTVGVYCGQKKLWKYQSKEKATCLHAVLIESEQVLVVGWSNSAEIQLRSASDGNVLWQTRINNGGNIVGLIIGDLRGHGHDQIIAVTNKGMITGWSTQPSKASVDSISSSISEQKEANDDLTQKDGDLFEKKILFSNFKKKLVTK